MRTYLEARKDRCAFVRRGIVGICLLIGGAAVAAAQIARTELVDPSLGGNGEEYGISVAISGDGRTALVGAPKAPCAAGSVCGKADVFARQGDGTWVLTATLVSPAPAYQEDFASSVALSQDGAIALVGASGHSCTAALYACGAAYVFELQGGAWALSGTLLSSTPQAAEGLGWGASLSGDGATAVLSIFGAGQSVVRAVYVFTRTGSGWSQMARLTSPGAGQRFGTWTTVSRDGSTILASASEPYSTAGGDVFVRSGGSWVWQTHLSTERSLTTGGSTPVALSGDGNIAVIGTSEVCQQPCGVTMFERTGSTWSGAEQTGAFGTIASNSRVGSSLALSDDGLTLWLGVPNVDCPNFSTPCGQAYLLKRSGTGFTLRQIIPYPFSSSGLPFPSWVAASADGSTAIMGFGDGPQAVFAYSTAGLIPDAPTLNGAGLAALAVLLAAAGALALRRRSAA